MKFSIRTASRRHVTDRKRTREAAARSTRSFQSPERASRSARATPHQPQRRPSRGASAGAQDGAGRGAVTDEATAGRVPERGPRFLSADPASVVYE